MKLYDEYEDDCEQEWTPVQVFAGIIIGMLAMIGFIVVAAVFGHWIVS